MKLVYQRQRGDCLIAAIATVAGVSWSNVKLYVADTRYGLDRTQTKRLLRAFQISHVYSMPHSQPDAAEWASRHPRETAILIVRFVRQAKYDHAVIAHRGKIFDPNRKAKNHKCKVIEIFRLCYRIN